MTGRAAISMLTATALAAGGSAYRPAVARPADSAMSPAVSMRSLIPKPVSVVPAGGTFTLSPATRVVVAPGTGELKRIGDFLAGNLRRATGFELPVVSGRARRGDLRLTTTGGTRALGGEGYALTIAPERVTLVARLPAGLFRGVQTIRQLLPPEIESSRGRGPWTIATGTIRDSPRFTWRGAMLDVARHFFGVADVKRFVDLIAYYKLNRLHLHLSDDQGWRIAISSWPRLTTRGGSTAVGGGRGGFFTRADYAEIVAYAERRYVTIVPEIDMPGHANAALASYSKLTCDGKAPPLYTGTEVGFSSLCTGKDVTYSFVDDVVRELAALTPGPWFHIGGDEAAATDPADYRAFIERVQTIVRSHGKRLIGWEEIAAARLHATSVAQHWRSTLVQKAVEQGAKVVMSPAVKTYLDMKYDASTPLGVTWAGHTGVRDAYSWDPATEVPGVSERDVLGVEAPLWTETIETAADIDVMVFPRLAGHAEVAWSRASGRGWGEYRRRLGTHGPRLDALGVRFHRSPEIQWR